MRFHRRGAAVILLAAVAGTAEAASELVLLDGRNVQAEEVRREGATYVVTLERGATIVLPVELVKAVRLLGAADDPEPVPDGPTGLRRTAPETLVGEPVRPSRPSEQLAALGPAAKFRRGIVDSTWRPESPWDPDRDVLAAGRSGWQEAIVDPSWRPRSAFDLEEDVLAGSRSEWPKSIIDPGWAPTDGFKRARGV